MQGFDIMLKAMGVDPEKMMAKLQEQYGPQIEAYGDALVAKLREEIVTPLMAKLDSLDAAIKEINPSYIPDEFKSGNVTVLPKLTVDPVTNPDLPDGGAVDMAALDAARLAEQGSLADQAALQPLPETIPGDVSSLEKEQPEALEPVSEAVEEAPASEPVPQVAEDDPFAQVREEHPEG